MQFSVIYFSNVLRSSQLFFSILDFNLVHFPHAFFVSIFTCQQIWKDNLATLTSLRVQETQHTNLHGGGLYLSTLTSWERLARYILSDTCIFDKDFFGICIAGWFRGYRLNQPKEVGIFPKSHVKVNRNSTNSNEHRYCQYLLMFKTMSGGGCVYFIFNVLFLVDGTNKATFVAYVPSSN